jgi:hypothetical protein
LWVVNVGVSCSFAAARSCPTATCLPDSGHARRD